MLLHKCFLAWQFRLFSLRHFPFSYHAYRDFSKETWLSRPGVGNPGLWPVLQSKILLKWSPARLFTYFLWPNFVLLLQSWVVETQIYKAKIFTVYLALKVLFLNIQYFSSLTFLLWNVQKSPLENMVDIIMKWILPRKQVETTRKGILTVCWLLGADGMNLWESYMGRFGSIWKYVEKRHNLVHSFY